MKVACLISSLGPGGAERQLAILAAGLSHLGHEVHFIIYNDDLYFNSILKSAQISVTVLPKCSALVRAWKIRSILRKIQPSSVIAFLETPALYAELASFPKSWRLVVGERSADPAMTDGVRALIRQLHRIADVVVCNSHTNRVLLERRFPFLKEKIVTIYNLIDLNKFTPATIQPSRVSPKLNLTVAASYVECKNLIGLARAVADLYRRVPKNNLVVNWFGATPDGRSVFSEAQKFIRENGLADVFFLHTSTPDISERYREADAVGLFSHFEGLPNAICEGMASGKPILCSNVCDAGGLVVDGVNGFLCDAASVSSISCALEIFCDTTEEDRARMGVESRRRAEALFASNKIIGAYELMIGTNPPFPSGNERRHFPNVVPNSVLNTLRRWGVK